MGTECEGQGSAVLSWLKTRVREPSTWVGLSMIAVVLGLDPLRAQSLAEAVSLIIGGGLVMAARKPKPGSGKREPGQ